MKFPIEDSWLCPVNSGARWILFVRVACQVWCQRFGVSCSCTFVKLRNHNYNNMIMSRALECFSPSLLMLCFRCNVCPYEICRCITLFAFLKIVCMSKKTITIVDPLGKMHMNVRFWEIAGNWAYDVMWTYILLNKSLRCLPGLPLH